MTYSKTFGSRQAKNLVLQIYTDPHKNPRKSVTIGFTNYSKILPRFSLLTVVHNCSRSPIEREKKLKACQNSACDVIFPAQQL